MKGFYIEITNNLLDPKHREAMRESVWLFMWCLDKLTSIDEDGIGKVLGGKPIKFEEVEIELGISERTYRRWTTQLKKEGYINLKRTPYGLILTMNKAKKRWAKEVDNKRRNMSEKTSDVPQTAYLSDKSVTSNKTVSVDNNNTMSAEPTDWNFDSKLEEMKKDPRRHIQIIALYWIAKKIRFENDKQYQPNLRRELKPATALSGYKDEDIKETIKTIENTEYLRKWTLETITKFINEVVSNKKVAGPKIIRWEQVTQPGGYTAMRPIYDKQTA